MRKYAIWITDSDNQDHLYSIVEGSLDEVYLQWIEPYESCEGDVWIDEVLVGEESPSFLYGLTVTYVIPEIVFGSTRPIQTTLVSKYLGTYGQLEKAFRIKYENEDWAIEIEELNQSGKRAEFVISDEIPRDS